MTTSVLSSLKVTARPEIKPKPPIIGKRMKLIERLEQQQTLAQCMLDNKPFELYRTKIVKDPTTGEKTKQRRAVTVRPWYFDNEGHYYLEIKVNNKPIELEKGKSAIDVGDKGKLPQTVETVIKAVEAGELDNFLLGNVPKQKVNPVAAKKPAANKK